MSTSQYRITQRRPLACQECTKRKRKCDKQVPCGRCRRLDLDCTREQVRLRKVEVKTSGETSFLKSLQNDLACGGDLDVAMLNRRIEDRISLLQNGTGELPERSLQHDTSSKYDTNERPPSSQILLSHDPKENDATILTTLEHLAWGRSLSGCYPHTNCSCPRRRNAEPLFQPETPSLAHISSRPLSPFMPSHDNARKLVEFHLEHISWHHNCLHSTTFLQQCEYLWSTGAPEHPQWLALYLAVLSTTLYCVSNSRKLRDQLSLDSLNTSPFQLFNEMVQTLYSSDFLANASIYSVQAIVISTEVAHNFGFSQLNANLLGAAIRIAQCLGLDRISEKTLIPDHGNETWPELVETETGKRVWCQMVIQDLFAIPFNGSYGIIPEHYSTGLPTNCDDDLIPQDRTSPTVSSYTRVLAKLASLMPELAEGLGPVKERKPLQQQYSHILKMDQKMRAVVSEIPAFLLQDTITKPAWLGIARRSLAVTAADKIIMIHRPFILRAFQSQLYAYTRRTCVAASLTILREHEAITRSDDLSLWTHTAFCITAAVILCFQAQYESATLPSGTTVPYLEVVRSARDRLANRTDDVLAARGVALIDIISQEGCETSGASAYHAPNSIDLPKVMEKFFATERSNVSPQGILSDLPLDFNAQDLDISLEDTSGFMLADDFEEWFNETFSDGRQFGTQIA